MQSDKCRDNLLVVAMSFRCVICLGIQRSEVSSAALPFAVPMYAAGDTSPVFSIHTSVIKQQGKTVSMPMRIPIRATCTFSFVWSHSLGIVVMIGFVVTPEPLSPNLASMLCTDLYPFFCLISFSKFDEERKTNTETKCEWQSVLL